MLTQTEFLTLASSIGHHLRSAGPCPTPEAWKLTKDLIRPLLAQAGITGAEFDARMKKVAGRARITKLERMGL